MSRRSVGLVWESMERKYCETNIAQRWERAVALERHYQRLNAIRRLPSHPTLSPSPVHCPAPDFSRDLSIQQANQSLLHHLHSIAHRKRSLSSLSKPPYPPLSQYVRRRRWGQIWAENREISRRLGEVRPSLSVKRMDREFELEERCRRLGSKTRQKELIERARPRVVAGKLEFRPALLPIPHMDLSF